MVDGVQDVLALGELSMGQARAKEIESAIDGRHFRDYFAAEVLCMIDEGKGQDVALLLTKLLERMDAQSEDRGAKRVSDQHHQTKRYSLAAFGMSGVTLAGLIFAGGQMYQKLLFVEAETQRNSAASQAVAEMRIEVRNMKDELQRLRESLDRRR